MTIHYQLSPWLRKYNHIRPDYNLNMQPSVAEILVEKSIIIGKEIVGLTQSMIKKSLKYFKVGMRNRS